MKTIYPMLAAIGVAFLVGSCTTGQTSTQTASNFIHRQNLVKTTKEKYPPKNPKTVSFYTKDKSPHMPYRVIGVAKVSKHNLMGLERQEDTLANMMKTMAASIGGDGLIDVDDSNESIEAKIIAFQKILI